MKYFRHVTSQKYPDLPSKRVHWRDFIIWYLARSGRRPVSIMLVPRNCVLVLSFVKYMFRNFPKYSHLIFLCTSICSFIRKWSYPSLTFRRCCTVDKGKARVACILDYQWLPIVSVYHDLHTRLAVITFQLSSFYAPSLILGPLGHLVF